MIESKVLLKNEKDCTTTYSIRRAGYLSMMNDPETLVSILMPARNAGAFIEECINSVLKQTYENWELIIVDDGSSDSTSEIAHRYQEFDSRIAVLNQPHKGIIQALRSALFHSKGKFITRIDADDIMPEYKIETLVTLLNKAGENHVATGFVEYFSSGQLGNGYKKYEKWLNRLTENSGNFSEVYRECCIASPCFMVFRKDLDRCGAFENDVYPEDYDLVFRFYKHGLKVVGSNRVLHRWRDHPQRNTRTSANYKDNTYIHLKIDFFLDIDYDQEKNLVIWGAGRKGKKVAMLLKQKALPFQWVCQTDSKVGQTIYGVKLENAESFDFENCQVIVLVANESEQSAILEHLKRSNNCEIFRFC